MGVLVDPNDMSNVESYFPPGHVFFGDGESSFHGKAFVSGVGGGWVPFLSRKVTGKSVIARADHFPPGQLDAYTGLIKSGPERVKSMMAQIGIAPPDGMDITQLTSSLLWAAHYRKK